MPAILCAIRETDMAGWHQEHSALEVIFADVPSAGADESVADEQAAAHMALNVGGAMCPAVGAEQTGVGQGARVSAIGLHLAGARGD